MQAIAGTAAVRWLLGLRGRRRIIVESRGRQRAFGPDPTTIDYLLEPRELFARVYAQYVATASGEVTLLRQLDEIRSDTLTGRVYHQQWTTDDFLPVSRAMDAWMRGIGWIA